MVHDKGVQACFGLGPKEANGYPGSGIGGMRTHQCAMHPGVHRTRLNSTETEI